MDFVDTPLRDAKLVKLQSYADERGSFARLHCEQEFERAGIASRMVQTNLSLTSRRGTIRGMHFQAAPSREAKLVRCVGGKVFDVIIDLRPQSSTYCRHFGVELDGVSGLGLFVPAGFAHGFQTLANDAAVLYQMTDYYQPALSRGVRWNDPAFGIRWPLPVTTLNDRDATYAEFDAELVRGFASY
jgi:dTDP-4-dehydrorhamnose 3,5-epimerase